MGTIVSKIFNLGNTKGFVGSLLSGFFASGGSMDGVMNVAQGGNLSEVLLAMVIGGVLTWLIPNKS